jgi:hypothetical protein
MHYGYDCGRRDLDLGKNDDFAAVQRAISLDHSSMPDSSRLAAFTKGGYYARPVPITISRVLTPLPSVLLGNSVNLMYFHHFLNHTARVLVPDDCPNNPLATVLPASRYPVPDSPVLSPFKFAVLTGASGGQGRKRPEHAPGVLRQSPRLAPGSPRAFQRHRPLELRETSKQHTAAGSNTQKTINFELRLCRQGPRLSKNRRTGFSRGQTA